MDLSEHEIVTRRQRWAEAAPKMAMAFCEAGYPATFHPGDYRGAENTISFDVDVPLADVVQRAFEVCGIGDLWLKGW